MAAAKVDWTYFLVMGKEWRRIPITLSETQSKDSCLSLHSNWDMASDNRHVCKTVVISCTTEWKSDISYLPACFLLCELTHQILGTAVDYWCIFCFLLLHENTNSLQKHWPVHHLQFLSATKIKIHQSEKCTIFLYFVTFQSLTVCPSKMP